MRYTSIRANQDIDILQIKPKTSRKEKKNPIVKIDGFIEIDKFAARISNTGRLLSTSDSASLLFRE